MLAPMAGVSGGNLAAAVTRGGGFAFIVAGHAKDSDAEAFDAEVEIMKATEKRRFGIGFIGHSSMAGGDLKRIEAILDRHQPLAAQFFAPPILPDGSNVKLCKDKGVLVFAQVGSVEEARQALNCGVDCIIAQGREAGGHGLRSELGTGTLPLATRVVDLAHEISPQTVVLAAGGITDGRGLAAALSLGCDGIVLGTRLWASHEALGDPSGTKREALLNSDSDDVLRTRTFDTLQYVDNPTAWPNPYDSVGALKNKTTAEWHGKEDELEKIMQNSGDTTLSIYREANLAGDVTRACVLAGEGVGNVCRLHSAEDIVRVIEEEAVAEIRRINSLI
ncbi:hypothetical protein TL16_g10800, partial [Triparma laevis f. inornata]